MIQPVSVTVIAGSLDTSGANFLENMLTDLGGKRVTAIIPARSGQKPRTKNGVSMLPTTERFKRLGQGCSCCTVRSDLITKIKRISADRTADHIVIHLTPKSDLDVLNKTFTVADTDGARLGDIARLESVITVIDGSKLLDALESKAGHSLISRIEHASMLALENTAPITSDMHAKIVDTIKAINPRARMVGDELNEPGYHAAPPLICNLPG